MRRSEEETDDTEKERTFELSPEIHYLGKEEELGELYKVYPVLKRYTGLWAAGIICSFFGGILAVTFVVLAILLPTIPPAPGTEPMSMASILTLWAVTTPGFILLIAGLYLIFSQRIYSPWQISLWQHGFIYEKKQLHQAFRWSRIECVQSNVTRIPDAPFPTVYACKVRRQDGYEVTLGSAFSGISELIDTVLEKSARQLASQELTIASPKNISTFAHFTLDRQGIRDAQETLSWQEIREFVTKNGTVTLRKETEQS